MENLKIGENENLSGIKTVLSAYIPIEYFALVKELSDLKKISKSDFVANALKDYIIKVQQA